MFSKNKLLEKTSEIFYHNFQLSISRAEGDEEKNENTEICNLGVKFMENILAFFQCVIAAVKYDTDVLFWNLCIEWLIYRGSLQW